jgi:hypothetical protein
MTKRSGASAHAHNAVLVSTLQALGFSDVSSYGTPSLSDGGVVGLL